MSHVPFYVGRHPTISSDEAKDVHHLSALLGRLEREDVEAANAIEEIRHLEHHEPHDYARFHEIVSRLDRSGDQKTADTICWLLWWNDVSMERHRVQSRLN